MKRSLQIVLAILSLIPLYFAITGVLQGAEGLNGSSVNADLDNQFRYLSAFYLILVFLIWWIIPRIDEEVSIFRIVVIALFLGGLARLYSYLILGTPQPIMLAGMALELGAPILILWQNMIRKKG